MLLTKLVPTIPARDCLCACAYQRAMPRALVRMHLAPPPSAVSALEDCTPFAACSQAGRGVADPRDWTFERADNLVVARHARYSGSVLGVPSYMGALHWASRARSFRVHGVGRATSQARLRQEVGKTWSCGRQLAFGRNSRAHCDGALTLCPWDVLLPCRCTCGHTSGQ